MACLNPYLACQDLFLRSSTGASPVKIFGRASSFEVPGEWKNNPRYKYFNVPCGKCILCMHARAFEIGVRARCEAALHDQSCFVTLTVSDENLENVFPGRRLTHEPFQKFMKRLRKAGISCRYLMCGEYGSRTHRPHYHVILFGWCPSDMYIDSFGCRHSSKKLEQLWTFGHVTVDRLNDNRCFYVAGYQTKPCSSTLYQPYVKWSRRPGLGAAFIEKYWTTVYQREVSWQRFEDGELHKLNGLVSKFVVGRNLVAMNSRFFNDRLQLLSPETFDKLQLSKQEYGLAMTQKSRAERDLFSRNLKNRAAFLEWKLARKERELVSYDG